MTFAEAIKSCYQKYATLSGRAGRSEFWYFNLLFYAPLLILYLGFEYGSLSNDFYRAGTGIFVLANFLPILAVSVRRLHDVNMSGWWLLIRIVPLLGDLYLLIKFCTKGDVGQNRYGVSAETRAVDQKDDLTEQYVHKKQGDTYLECTSGQYKGCKFPLTSEIVIGTAPSKCSIVVDKRVHPEVEPVHCVVSINDLGRSTVVCLATQGGVWGTPGGTAPSRLLRHGDSLINFENDEAGFSLVGEDKKSSGLSFGIDDCR